MSKLERLQELEQYKDTLTVKGYLERYYSILNS